MRCPSCGSLNAYEGFTAIECPNSSCPHYNPNMMPVEEPGVDVPVPVPAEEREAVETWNSWANGWKWRQAGPAQYRVCCPTGHEFETSPYVCITCPTCGLLL